MKNFLLVFIEIAYAVLQHPTEIPSYLKRIPNLPRHALSCVGLSAVSTALALYTVRDYYDNGVWILFPLLSFVHMGTFVGGGVLFGLLCDILVRQRTPDRPRQAAQVIAVALLSLLPLAFSLPLAFPVRFFSLRLGWSASFVMVPVVLGLSAWVFYVAIRGLQYLYEISLRRATIVAVQASLAIVLYPALLALFFALDLAQLIG